MIELVSFCKNYNISQKQKNAVDNISFVAPKNSITGLLGPNGAGKTTIIKAICSIHYPTSGNVFVYDKFNNKFDTAKDIEKTKHLIGYVTETPVLIKNFTVIEYLKMIYNVWKNTRLDINSNIDINERIPSKENISNNLEKVIFDFNLSSVLTKKISTLSKGFCQRVNFAKALIHNPEILILDEPSSGLDPNQIIETRKLIKKFSKEKTILLSTHIMSEAENLCDNVVIINQGKLLAQGSVEQIKKSTKSKTLKQSYVFDQASTFEQLSDFEKAYVTLTKLGQKDE